MKSICVLCSRYPNEIEPTKHVFLRNLVWEWLDLGIDVTVVSPVNILNKKLSKLPQITVEKNASGNEYTVYRPKYFSLPAKKLFFINTQRLFLFFWMRVCKRTIQKNNLQPDCFYGHFISPAGLCSTEMGAFFSKPSFVAYGESTDWSVRNYSKKFLHQKLSRANGIIAVSTKNKEFLQNMNICDSQRIEVFINGVNVEHCYPRDKEYSRSLFGIDRDVFIVAFVGQFIKRKGVDKLNIIVSQLDGVGAIFAGSGSLTPVGKNILYTGLVEPSEIPYFLSAADVFVLPTENEGCSNAILEALACGLPIISSNLPFNYDILDDSCAILIDPNNEDEIRDAILSLKNDSELRNRLAMGSLEKAKRFSLSKRAGDILRFMDDMA